MTSRPYPWHERNWRLLRQALSADRLPHALLLVGPRGIGKRAFAEAFAQSLLCGEPDAQGLACGQCRTCRFFAAGTHPDFRCLEPEEEGKPIKVDSVREFAAWSVMKPQEGLHRVTLIQPADAMNAAAANSLLKTLEEPVSGNLILLLTSRPSMLPPTVRSRCQRVVFAVPSQDEAVSWLSSQGGAGDWRMLLRLAKGAPLRALELAAGDAPSSRAARFAQFEGLLLGRAAALDLSTDWTGQPDQMLEWLGSWVRDLVRLHAGAGAEALENPDFAPALQRLSERLDWRSALGVLERVDRGARVWPRANLNLQMQMEEILISLAERTP